MDSSKNPSPLLSAAFPPRTWGDSIRELFSTYYSRIAFSQLNVALAQHIFFYSRAMFWELHFLIQELFLLSFVLPPHTAVVRRR